MEKYIHGSFEGNTNAILRDLLDVMKSHQERLANLEQAVRKLEQNS